MISLVRTLSRSCAPLMVPGVALVVLLTGAPALAEAQSTPPAYGRVTLSQPYAELSGAGMAHQVVGNQFNGALQVNLPFEFPYFGRTYRHAWLSTNGSVLFLDDGLDSNLLGSLQAPVNDPRLQGAIHALRADLVAGPERERAFTAHVLDGGTRVVFQWRRVAFAQGERLTELNFQVHLYDSGRIRLWYGPETELIADHEPFVSGIVSANGSISKPGFGDTLAQQTARPPANHAVDLVPDDVPATPSSINLVPSAATAKEIAVRQGQSDVVVAGFEMHAAAAGGTVDGVSVSHPILDAGDVVELTLVADKGEIGVYEPGIDPVLAMRVASVASTETTISFAPLQIGASESAHRFLLIATVTSVASPVFGEFSIRAGNVSATVPVYGGLRTPQRTFSPGPLVTAYYSTMQAKPVARAGDTNVLLASIQLRRREALGSTILNAFHVELLTGMDDSDIDRLRLYHDVNATGTREPDDPLLAQGAVSNLRVTFGDLALPVPADSDDGVALLVSADIAGDYASAAFLGVDQLSSSFAYSEPRTVTEPFGQPTTVRVLGSGERILVQPNEPHALSHVPAQPSANNLPAMSFTMQTGHGSIQLAGLSFEGNTANVEAARLYYDNGQHRGRWDFGDSRIATGNVGANVIDFPGLQVTLDDSPREFLLAIDLAPGVTNETRQFELRGAGVDAADPSVFVWLDGNVPGATPPVIEGAEIAIGEGSGEPGVDVAVSWATGSVNFGDDQTVPLAVVSALPRHGGGEVPEVVFSLVDSRGGVTDNTLRLVPYLDASGSGRLEEGDPDLIGRSAPLNIQSIVPLSQGVWPTVTTQSRVYIVGIRRDALVSGTCRVAFRGVRGGTNPQIVGWPNQQSVDVGAGDEPVAQGGGGGGGCASLPLGPPAATWLPLGLLVLLLVAGRRRQLVPGAQPQTSFTLARIRG